MDAESMHIVIAVVSIIFIGVAAYLFFIDLKVHRLEKKLKDKGDE